ncbi:uncharacterized protein si:dkey-1h24.6 isoform X2 [Xiphias gladius]|uniref:uncharacterized protein si:dkey-1h24.6 isoform X2 n=1 Tax=Xiphias gladius TaxID=8245 RepID=UPI001A987681|nr:uncharacterized protein si:dkey-1h24.6 isoform X2 [Xiphias gladius]
MAEQLKTVCVPGRDKVRVPCPNGTADVMIFNLLRDQEVIANLTCHRENNTLKCTNPHTWVDTKVEENNQHTLVSFILTGLSNSSHETYACEGIFIYPPPLRRLPSAVRIQVLEEGQLCKCNKNSNIHGDNPRCGFTWIWILVFVLLSIYSVISTVIALVNWVKLRKTDSQSDYMNTKPRAPRDRKKKKGVQNPMPRYF